MRLPPPRCVACLALAAASLLLSPAQAEPAEGSDPLAREPPDDAKLVYRAAARAYEERRYEEAIDLFHRADRLTPNPAFDFNIGLAYEDMGDSARALASYRAYLRRLPNAPDRADVDARIARLEKVLEGRGLQQVTILSEPPGARIEVDGFALGLTPWTGEIEPGFHRLTLERKDHRIEERTFDLPPSRAIDVPVTLTKAPPPKPAPDVPPAPPAKEPCVGTCLSAISTESWVIGALGTASLAGALVFEVHRAGRVDAAERETDQVASARLVDRAIASQKWATVCAVSGGALLLTGTALALLDIHEAKQPEEVAWDLGCGPSGCAFELTQSF